MVSRGVFFINVNEPIHSKAIRELVNANLDMLVMSLNHAKKEVWGGFVEVVKILRSLDC